MALDATDRQTITAWFDARGGSPTCPVCKGVQWVSQDLLGLPTILDGKVALGRETFVVLPMVCVNCAYCLFFNAVLMGLNTEE